MKMKEIGPGALCMSLPPILDLPLLADIHGKILDVRPPLPPFKFTLLTSSVLKVAEFPKLALKHGILLNLPI